MFFTVMAFMMLSTIPTQVKAADNTKTVTTATTKSDVSTEAALSARLDEIKAMDMSTLTRSEKKELKSEVKAIKSHQEEIYVTAHHHHSGVYFGAGGLLVVILIIILVV